MIGELTDTSAKRIAEYKRRRKPYIEQTFQLDEQEDALSQGWELVRENKASLRYRKIRDADEQLENEFWRLLYDFGYPKLSVGRNFNVLVSKKPDIELTKNIDVFAYDNETIIVAECIAYEKRTKQSLQNEINDLITNQRNIAQSLRSHFEGNFPQKIIWLIVTRNLEWSESDIKRAHDGNINILTEREIFYYKEIAKRIGHSARFQFHAEFLAKTKVAALDNVKVYAIRTRLGAHKVFTFFAPASKILPISFVNHRDLRDPSAAPSYQRLLQRPRLRQITDFVKSGGFFPNTIILNFKQKVQFDVVKSEDDDGVTSGILTLPNTYKSAWIIDGQHRIYGYSELEDDTPQSLLPFLAFENISISEETKLFSDINSKQKRVEKKLLDEITGEIKLESSDKREQIRAISSRAFDMMREDDDGPLGGKIAGVEVKQNEYSILTIPYLVDAVIQSGIMGRITQKDGRNTYVHGSIYWTEPREAIDHLMIFLSEYLNLFRLANLDRWEAGKNGKFASNPGVAGLIRFAGDLISHLCLKRHVDTRSLHPKVLVEEIEEFAKPAISYFQTATDLEVEQRFQIPFGSGGPRIFQHRLRELVGKQFSDFEPPGFRDDLRKYDAERTDTADRWVRAVQEEVHRHVVEVLRREYGPGDDYLEKGIDNKEILKKAFDKRLDADGDDKKDMATYLDFLDLRKIVESQRNWSFFSDSLNIQLPSERKGKAKYVAWFDEINKARRVSAHPYNRGYSDEEVSTIEFVFNELHRRGVIAGRN
ncbi:DGQHR domain-containing protein [Inquilinus sp. Marseille-Q2685]|uniref:DGQHR domain-containing protein n=1 Tax=Inquilinus sp. Marseille-Q2685 TaxID=2866581 RepID=UPI001CE4511C|nr:DGQHR domain-containing protein [Inquilinus sp. Marseille-Q2685]